MKAAWQAILFDLDGTLVDTLGDLADAANEVLRRHGYPTYPEDAYRLMVGNGVRRLLERALGDKAAESVVDRLLAEFIPYYDAHCLCRTAPYAGMAETVQALRKKGVRLAVVTNKPEAQARKVTRHIFGEDVFEVILGSREGRPAKPDSAGTREALARVGVCAQQALFVGDSDVDMVTAHNAGLPGAGAIWGFRGEEELRRAGADLLLQNPAEILNYY